MSGRKRKSNSESASGKWKKERYLEELKSLGITANTTWTLDFLNKLYEANKVNSDTAVSSLSDGTNPNSVSIAPSTSGNPVGDINNAPVEPRRVPPSHNTRTEDILKETTSALKTATEALSAMSGVVKGIVNRDLSITSHPSTSNKTQFDLGTASLATYGQHFPQSSEMSAHVDQTYRKQIDTSKGVVFAEDLPKMDFVAATVRKQIVEGKDVNLACLLTPKYDNPQSRTLQSEGLTVELSTPKDLRLEYNLSLDEFNKAFRKYRNILCKVYPQRRDELDQYEADINDIAHIYGSRFYTYHKMFSAKAANAIIEHNVVISWAKVDDRLLHQVMHGTPSRECELCGEFDHSTRFCERNKHKIIAVSDTPQTPRQNMTSFDRSLDKHGRTISRVEGKEICNNFNYNSCNRKECPFVHACNKCNAKDHGMKNCVGGASPYRSVLHKSAEGKKFQAQR